MRERLPAGYSLLELLFVMAFISSVGGMAAGALLAGMSDFTTASGTRYLAAQLQRARMEAVTRRSNVAVRFERSGGAYRYRTYVDGNGDGVRAQDIQRGIDRPLHASESISDLFANVEVGTIPGLPAVDPSSPAPGDDPVKFGASNMATFTALGSSTAGSLYVRGPRQAQYVIRLFGETGKSRLLKFDAHTRRWEEQ